MAALDNLSERDKAVLRCIFDPTATIGDVVEDGDNFPDEESEPASPAHEESRMLTLRAMQLAESGKLTEALELMNEAVAAAPERASVYNDRAQLLRLMLKDSEAMSDLERVIQLTEGRRTRARALALCQRGVLLRKLGSAEGARAAFTEAAKLGSGFAKKQVVEMNPYAALCNQMLSQVMRGEEIKL
ncbi:unnamed protein product, partial [Iphiclides podalirius]